MTWLQTCHTCVTCLCLADFSIDCKTDAVLIKWPLKLTQEQLHNPYTVLLGNCVPSTVNGEEVVFHVAYDDCLFKSMVRLAVEHSTVSCSHSLTYPLTRTHSYPLNWTPIAPKHVFTSIHTFLLTWPWCPRSGSFKVKVIQILDLRLAFQILGDLAWSDQQGRFKIKVVNCPGSHSLCSQVFGNKVAFVNLLTYRPGLNVPAQSHMVECVFDKYVHCDLWITYQGLTKS